MPTLNQGKHQSWVPFSVRVKPSTQKETKHLFGSKVRTVVLKNKNVTVSAHSGAKFGIPGANNLKRPCMDKRQRKERVNRHSVVSETEKTPEDTRYQMFSTPLAGNDPVLRAQRPLLWAEHPNPPVPPHQAQWFGTGWAKTQQRFRYTGFWYSNTSTGS